MKKLQRNTRLEQRLGTPKTGFKADIFGWDSAKIAADCISKYFYRNFRRFAVIGNENESNARNILF